MGQRASWRRSSVRTAAASCIATIALLAGATAGSSRATADDPGEEVGEAPAQVMQAFVPALPGGPQPVEQILSGVEVTARLVGSGTARSVEVDLHNRTAAQRAVSCEVVLERVSFPGTEVMSRVMPPPEISAIHTVPINAALQGGERLSTVARVPAEALGADPASGSLRLTIRERS